MLSCLQATKELGYELFSFEELIQMGKDKPAEPIPPKPEDLCTIMYTSGGQTHPDTDCTMSLL